MIHSTAVIDPKAEIGADCEIGPYCIIGPNVTLGVGNKLHSHVVIDESVNENWDSVIHQFNTGGAGILQDPTIARTPYSGAVQSTAAAFHYLLVRVYLG